MAGTNFEVVVTARLDNNSAKNIQKELDTISKGTTLKINADSSQIDKVTKSLNEAGKTAENTSTHMQGLGDIISKFSSWQIVGDVIHGVKDAMQDMVQQVFDLDESLTEFNKVTDVTPEQLEQITESAYDLGEQLGRTGKEAIDAATEFSKAGYKDSALDLAQTALLYQNIADEQVSTSDATALIVSQMKAFNVEAEDSMEIIDQINEVDIRASRHRNVA